MPVVPINYLAVLACAIASMVLGFLWYGPLFGKLWMSLSGMSPEQIEECKAKGGGGGNMMKSYVLMFIGSLVMAYVLARSNFALQNLFGQAHTLPTGLLAGFWSWLGFIAPVTLGTVLWEGKSWKLWMLNNAYYLVLLLIMGSILAVWM